MEDKFGDRRGHIDYAIPVMYSTAPFGYRCTAGSIEALEASHIHRANAINVEGQVEEVPLW